jgi:hypothetical protein
MKLGTSGHRVGTQTGAGVPATQTRRELFILPTYIPLFQHSRTESCLFYNSLGNKSYFLVEKIFPEAEVPSP